MKPKRKTKRKIPACLLATPEETLFPGIIAARMSSLLAIVNRGNAADWPIVKQRIERILTDATADQQLAIELALLESPFADEYYREFC